MLHFYLASFCVALALGQGHATVVKFSSNVSEIEVGKPFLATCRIEAFSYFNPYQFVFKFNGHLLATFYRASHEFDIQYWSGNVSHFEISENGHPFTVSGGLMAGNFSINVTPKTDQAGAFWCEAKQTGSVYKSDEWRPKVKSTHKSVSLRFSTNVTKVESGKPFTASCVISDFDAENKNYVVHFWRTSGLLGSYEVKAPTKEQPKPHTMFVETKHTSVTVHHGLHFAYPTFEVQLVPLSDVSENYWCQLEVGNDKSQVKSQAKSNVVPNVPTLAYSSLRTSDGHRLDRCSISDNFKADKGSEYSVKFMVSSKELATFIVKPNQPDDFIVQDAEYKIVHGANVTLPNFEILFTTPSAMKGQFACILGVGHEGEKSYEEFKSNDLHVH